MTSINAIAAAEHRKDLEREAARRRLVDASDSSGGDTPSAITIRLAQDDDAQLARRLAALDDARQIAMPALLALVDGEPVAALSLIDGRVVADPFVFTQDAVALLQVRADHLAGRVENRQRLRARLRLRAA